MKKHLVPTFILIAYSAILVKVMVFKDLPLIRIGSLMLNFGGTHEGPANLIPFKTILPYLLGQMGLMIAVINLAGNIVLLVPVGFLVPFVYRNATWKKMLLLGVAVGFGIEGMQAVLHIGIFDIDDVILNALGVMIGYWMFEVLANWTRSRNYKNIIIAAVIIIAAAVGTIYAVYPKGQQAVNSSIEADSIESNNFDNPESGFPESGDPCNGTGGLGEIINMANKTITVRRNDGIKELINFTDHTKIRTSAGAVSTSAVKLGDRVTVVIRSNHVATLILICNEASAKPIK